MTPPDIFALFQNSPVIWLAPNELTLSQIKRELFQRRPAASQQPRLETFNSLERSLAAELSPPEADELSRLIMLSELARPLAEALGNDGTESSPADLKKLGEDLGDAFDRLKLAGLDWDQVAALPPARLGRLVAELGRRHDLKMKEAGRLDRFGRRRQVLDELAAGRPFAALAGVTELVCRWSQRLSPFETDFLLALAVGRQVRLSLKIPAWIRDENIDHGSGFDLLRSIRKLEKIQNNNLWLEFERLDDGPAPPPLAYAAENLLAPLDYRSPQPPEPDGRLRLLAAPTAYHEVEEAARRLKELLAEGLEPDGLALVVPDVDRYAPLLDDVARRFGLAFHSRRGRPLSEYGPVRAALDLLELWTSNWERSRLAELMRSPYFIFTEPPLDPAEINRLTLACGLSDRRAGGGPELLAKAAGADRAPAALLLNIFSKLQEAGQRAAEAGGWPELIAVYTQALNDFLWPGHLEEAPLAPLNLRAADYAAALAFKEELGRLAEALAQSDPAPKASLPFLQLWLKSLLDQRHLSWDRDPEGRIRVMNYYDLHGGVFEEIFFLGLNERIFPRTGPRGRWWPEEFASAARRLLGRPLWNEETDSYRQEELLLAVGLSQARRRVWLGHHQGDDSGKESLPSPLLAALRELWADKDGLSPLVIEPAGGHNAAPLEKAAARDEMLLALSRLPLERWPEELRRDEGLSEMMKDLGRRRRRWAKLKKEAAPGPEIMAGWLATLPRAEGLPLVAPSFPAAFAACPFAFWAGQVLGLDPDGGVIEEWPRSSEGSLMHAVLERFFRPRLASLWPGDADYQACLAELLEIFRQECEKHERSQPLGRLPLWPIRRRRLEELLGQWLEREMNSGENVSPLAVEWSFGPAENDAAGPYKFKFPDGRAICFKGRADRLDRGDGGLFVRDYKLGDRLGLRLTRDGDRQEAGPAVWPLLVYTLAAAGHFGQKTSATFEILDPAGRSARIPALASDRPEMLPPTGDEEEGFNFPQAVARAWDGISEGRFPPEGDEAACAWCPFGLICPRDDEESGEEEP